MDHPVLATSTDGVGTKVAIAQAMERHDTIGFDLVGMVVDDLVVCGAEPLFMTDYIACGKVEPERIATIVKGIAEACTAAGCALLGGETAEHPGLLEPREYDIAGAATGVVERDLILGAERVRPGDVVLAMESSGLHSNGYSLVRHVLRRAGWSLDHDVPELGHSIGDELLVPTRIYSLDCLALISEVSVHAMSHITGGGLANNLARVIPGRLRGPDRPHQLAAGAGLRAGRAAGRGPAARPGGHREHGGRHGRGAARGVGRRRRTPARWSRSACLGLRLGRSGRVGHPDVGQPVRRTPGRLSDTPGAPADLRFAALGPLGSIFLTTSTILSRG